MKAFLFILFLLLNFSINIGFSQDLNTLKKQKEENQKAIDLANELLQKAGKEKSQTIDQLALINAKIVMRNKMIENISKEIEIFNVDLTNTNYKIADLDKNLNLLKAEYAKTINNYFKTRSKQNLILYIFSSRSFNQAYKRIQYFKQYTDYLKSKKQQIIQSKTNLFKYTTRLDSLIKEKEKLLSVKTREQINLNEELTNYSNVLKDLKKHENKLKTEIENRKKKDSQLQIAIEKFIESEAKKIKEKDKKLTLTPDEKNWDDNFAKNKGFLPWPAERGIITGEFGEHPHPVYKNLIIRNNGIDISVPANSEIRSVFKGEVKSIVSIPGANKAVIIRHGSFLSVYSNLAEVMVKTGDFVETKQTIGIIFTDLNQNFSVLNFQIWKENTKLNPADWIKTNPETANLK